MRMFEGKKESIQEIAAELGGKSFYVALHRHADPDALGSAYALTDAFGGLGILAPGGLDRNAQQLAGVLDVNFVSSPDASSNLVVVDTPDTSQLGGELLEKRRVIVIDHHSGERPAMADAYYADDQAFSCSEIVMDIIVQSGRSIGTKGAKALLSGIFSDTGGLRRGDAGTFFRVSGLLAASGMNMEEALAEFRENRDKSEQVAILKGLERMRHTTAGAFFIGMSQVSSYESSVASAILRAGADVALVASDREGTVRVSGRSSFRATESGLNLADVFTRVSYGFNASSGGHRGAAVLEGKGDPEAFLNACAAECSRILEGGE